MRSGIISAWNAETRRTITRGFSSAPPIHFNFSDCPMTEEGIRFTVTAEADGYAPSVSRTFVYNRTLSAVTGLHFDEGEQKLVWDAVPEATGYILSVRCGDSAHAHEFVDNGSKTSYSLKECAPGRNYRKSISVYEGLQLSRRKRIYIHQNRACDAPATFALRKIRSAGRPFPAQPNMKSKSEKRPLRQKPTASICRKPSNGSEERTIS